MSRRKRRIFTADFKAKVILDALKERATLAELAQKSVQSECLRLRSLQHAQKESQV